MDALCTVFGLADWPVTAGVLSLLAALVYACLLFFLRGRRR